MKRIIGIAAAILAVVIVGGIGAFVYYTQFGGRDQAALAAVQEFFADYGVEYETLVLEGGEIVGADLAWTAEDGTRATADRMVLRGLDTVAAAGAAVSSGPRPQLLAYGALEDVAVTLPRDGVPIRVERLTVEDFSARRLLDFISEMQAPGVDPLIMAERLLNDVVGLGAVRMEAISFDAGDGPVIDLALVEAKDVGDGGLGLFAVRDFTAFVGANQVAGLGAFEIEGLEAADALATLARLHGEGAFEDGAELADFGEEFDELAKAFGVFELKRLAALDFKIDPRALGEEGPAIAVGEYSFNDILQGRLGSFLVREASVDMPAQATTPPIAVALGRIAFEDFNLGPIKTVVEQLIAATQDPTGRLPDPEAFEEANVALQLGSSYVIEDLTVDIFGGVLRVWTPTPTTVTGDLNAYEADTTFRANLGPLDALPAPPPIKAVLAARDLQELTLDYGFDMAIDRKSRDWTIENGGLSLERLGGVAVNGDFGGLGYTTTLSQDAANPFGAFGDVYGDATVKTMTVTLTDTGLSGLIFDLQAIQSGGDPTQLRAAAAGSAQAFLPGAIAAPFVNFLNEGGRFTLTIAPPEPAPFLALQGAFQDPAAFGVKAEHAPN